MAADRDTILRELGQKMLDEIDMMDRRLAEELEELERAPQRIADINVRRAVLREERDKLIARGQPGGRTPANDSALVAVNQSAVKSRP